MVGESDREVFLQLDNDVAFALVEAAGEKIGSILSSSQMTGTLEIKTSFGLQSVNLRVSLLPHENGTKIFVSGFGDDVWGDGASKVGDTFLEAIEELMDQEHPPGTTSGTEQVGRILLPTVAAPCDSTEASEDLLQLVDEVTPTDNGGGEISGAVDENPGDVYSMRTSETNNVEVTDDDGSLVAAVRFTGSSLGDDEPVGGGKSLGEKIRERDEQKVAEREQRQQQLLEWQEGVDERRGIHVNRDRKARRAFIFVPSIPPFLVGGLLLILWIPSAILSKFWTKDTLVSLVDDFFTWGIFIMVSAVFIAAAAYALMHFSEQAERNTVGLSTDSNLVFRPFLEWRSWFRQGPNWIDRLVDRVPIFLRRMKPERSDSETTVPAISANESTPPGESGDEQEFCG